MSAVRKRPDAAARTRKDYVDDGSIVYIEQWVAAGWDAENLERRHEQLCRGGAVWQVAEMDTVLATRAPKAGFKVPPEVREAAFDRKMFRMEADKMDLTQDDNEPAVTGQQAVQDQSPTQDAGRAYPTPTSDAEFIEIGSSSEEESDEETPRPTRPISLARPRRPISPELGVGVDTTQPAPSLPSRRRSRSSTIDSSSRSQAKRPRRRNLASGGRQLPHKKDASICPGEDPATNLFHEAHLFTSFRLPSPDKEVDKQPPAKQLFHLRNVVLTYGEGTTNYRSLLNLAKGKSRSGLELVGFAVPYYELETEDSDERPGSEESDDLEQHVRRRVRLVATDFVNLKPGFMSDSTSDDCALILETRLARYLIGSPAKEYLATFQDAPVLLNLLAWGIFCEVRPSSTSSSDTFGDLRRSLSASLRSTREMDAYLSRAVNLEYRLNAPLSESLTSIKRDVLDLLQQWLPNPIFVTPFVYEHLQRLRVDTGTLVRTDLAFDSEAAQQRIDADEAVLASLDNIFKLSLTTETAPPPPGQPFGRQFNTRRSKTTRSIAITIFDAVTLDGETIRIGDYVMVNGSEKKRAPDRMKLDGGNPRGLYDEDSAVEGEKVWWVAKIVYFFRTGTGTLRVHLSWIQRATQTWLGPAAPPLLLFYGDWCSSEPADSIVCKLEVERLPIATMRPRSESLHYSYAYDPTECSYTEASLLEDTKRFPLCDASNVRSCACCERRMAEDAELLPVHDAVSESLAINGFVFHRNDFVYVSRLEGVASNPDAEGERPSLRLALLESIDGPKLRIRWLFRHDEVFDSVRDPRRLVLSDVVAEIQPDRVEGAFRLEHTARLKAQEVGRRTTQDREREAKGEPPITRTARSDDEESAIRLQSYLSKSHDHFYCADRLVGSPYDLTSGSPPLSAPHGEEHRRPLASRTLERLLCSSCALKWADDAANEQVVIGLRRKHPSLRHAGLEGYAGAGGFMKGVESGCHAIEPRHAVETDSFAQELLEINYPRSSVTGDARPFDQVVEAAYNGEAPSMAFDYFGAGPPCQGFSSLNRFKAPEDRRTFEPLAWVSGVDVFHPLVALFENVRGITGYNLPVLPGAAPCALLPTLNMLSLLLGYQCRTAILNAASHGSPQSRRRLIMMLTPRSLDLPALPLPTHSFSLSCTQLRLDDSFEKSRSHVSQRRCDGIAPHPAVTIADAISDLPPKEMALGTIDEDRQPFAPVMWLPGATLGDGGPEPYQPSAPSRYQLSARIVLTGQDYETISLEVCDHYVRTPSSELVVQRYINLGVAGEAGQYGNYRDLDGLEEGALPIPPRGVLEDPKKLETWWQRLRWTDVATTVRTSLNGDGSSHGPRIHPTQRRLLTVRELARLQGFIDAFHFGSQPGMDNTEAQIRAIGNAVPGQLGSAIGREIDAMLSKTVLAHVARHGEAEAGTTFDHARAVALRHHDERRGNVMDVDGKEEYDE